MSDSDLDEVARNLREAERATSSDDHRAAEHALRQALKLQEAHFGLDHPEVANTLNLLGLVCGVLGRPDESEFLHRRALGIARRTVGSEHPTVTASLQHLSKLYSSQGKPEKLARVSAGRLTTSSRSDIDGKSETGETSDTRSRAGGTSYPAAAFASLWKVARESLRAEPPRFLQAAIFVVVVGVLLASVLWFWLGSGKESDKVAGGSALNASVGEVELAPRADDVDEVGDTTGDLASQLSEEPTPFFDPPAALTGEESVVVSSAEVCSQLVTRGEDGSRLLEWQCDPVNTGARTGQLFFYTRVRSRGGTNIEHRWYRDGSLDQRIVLEVAANNGPGYRTYSVRAVSPQDSGSWKRGPTVESCCTPRTS